MYYGTGTRALELLFGALLALVLTHPKGFVLRVPNWAWTTAGVVGAVVTLALWTSTTQESSWLYQGGLAGYALMSCLFIVAAVRKGPVRSVLSMRWLCALGAISYGVYLFHWPIYLWLTPRRTGLDPWPLFGLRLAVTLALAIVSARLVEMPIRRRRFPVRVNPLVLSGACRGGDRGVADRRDGRTADRSDQPRQTHARAAAVAREHDDGPARLDQCGRPHHRADGPEGAARGPRGAAGAAVR